MLQSAHKSLLLHPAWHALKHQLPRSIRVRGRRAVRAAFTNLMRLLLLFLSLSRGERCSRAVLRTTPASYSDPDLPVLIDLHDVLIRDTSVLVFCPDAESRRAIKAVDGKLTPRMLRVPCKACADLRGLIEVILALLHIMHHRLY